jgi:hypothetical protein
MMIFRAIFKIIPIPVFYVDSLPNGFAGMSNGIFIRIDKDYKEDIGLLEHELVHCRQFFLLPVIHSILYKSSNSYRYWAELQAYRKQLEFSNNKESSVEHFAKFLSEKYGLDVSIEKAKADLLK